MNPRLRLSLRSLARSRRATQTCRRDRSFRPMLEHLEDRIAPSVTIPPSNNNGDGFIGLTYSQSNGRVPPDSTGAAGPANYVETVNQSIALYFPNTPGAPTQVTSLQNFWFTQGGLTNPPGASSKITLSDPTVIYDDNIPGQPASNGRFIVSDQNVDQFTHVSNFFLAVSKTAIPTSLTAADWNFYQINTTENGGTPNTTWDADYQGNVGYNHTALVFPLDMFSAPGSTTVNHVQVNSVDISALTAPTPTLKSFQTDVNGFHLRATAMHDDTGTGPSDPMWLVTEHNGGDGQNIDVIKMTNILSNSPTFAPPTTLAVNPYTEIVAPSFPEGGPGAASPSGTFGGPFQPNGQLTTLLDSRILKVAEANNTLVATQMVTDSIPSAVTGMPWDRDLARWYAIDVSSGTPILSQQGNVSAPTTGAGQANVYDLYPSIDINRSGQIGMTFMQSSFTGPNAGQFLSMYVTGRSPSDPSGTMQTPVLVPAGQGVANYSNPGGINSQRLGDLSGISVDPLNGSFWAANEFADNELNGSTGNANWGTAIANLIITPTPPTDTVGVFDPFGQYGWKPATWFLRYSNSPGAPDVPPFSYGGPGWISVVGDWDGDGIQTIGVVDPSTMTWYLRNSNSPGAPDITFQYGAPGDIPVVGDWTGQGFDTVGVFDPFERFGHPAATWYLRNSNSAGPPDIPLFQYGAPDWVPVVGDWTGTGVTTVGMFDPIGQFGQLPATWYLRNSNSAGAPDIAPFAYGAAGWKPVVGDWKGAGVTTIGVFDPVGQFGRLPATWFLRYSNSPGAPDIAPFAYGAAGWVPVVGLFPPAPQFLLAADGQGPGGDPLGQDQLQAAVAGALARLGAAGADPGLLGSLGSASFGVADLPPGVLGETDVVTRQVLISADAAGHGWFADATPLADGEFAPGAPGSPLVALPGSPAAGKEDLLTAVLHEMGHLTGRLDSGTGLMEGALGLGTRDLGALDQVFSGPGALAL